MTAAESVEVVLYRGVILLVCSLDTALSHHCVSVTDTKLCNDHYVSACIVSLDSAGRTCSAAADNEYVYVVIDLGDINLICHKAACGMEHLGELNRSLLTLVGTDLDLSK